MSVRIYGVCTVYMITTKPDQRVCNTKGPVVVQGKGNIMLKIKEMLESRNLLKKVAKITKLHKVPSLEYTDGEYLMASVSGYKAKGTLFNEMYTETWAKYQVLVNLKAVQEYCSRMSMICLSARAGYDTVYGILLHEFRHAYQAQSGFMVGRAVETPFSEMFDGHGSDIREVDANDFMIEHAKNRKQRVLFEYIKLQQSSDGLCTMYDREYRHNLYMKRKEVIKAYNPVFHWVISLLNLEIRFPFRVGEKK